MAKSEIVKSTRQVKTYIVENPFGHSFLQGLSVSYFTNVTVQKKGKKKLVTEVTFRNNLTKEEFVKDFNAVNVKKVQFGVPKGYNEIHVLFYF